MNSALITLPASIASTAKEINAGGTLISIKVPDMESLPPIAGISSSLWTFNAPRRAAKGLPQEDSSVSFSKYSWKDNLIFSSRPPIATTFVAESITAYIAPWKGEYFAISGSYPYVITVAVSVSPSTTGNFAAIPIAGES